VTVLMTFGADACACLMTTWCADVLRLQVHGPRTLGCGPCEEPDLYQLVDLADSGNLGGG
jgi:hypothetical protein